MKEIKALLNLRYNYYSNVGMVRFNENLTNVIVKQITKNI